MTLPNVVKTNSNSMAYGSSVNSNNSKSQMFQSNSSGYGTSTPPPPTNVSPRKRSTNSIDSKSHNDAVDCMDDCTKSADFMSLLPMLNQFNGMMNDSMRDSFSIANTTATPNTTSTKSREPIYIVISTNPLILLPFSFNPVTNTMEPMANNASSSINFSGNSSMDGGVGGGLLNPHHTPLPSTPVVFPNGLPQMMDQSQMNFAAMTNAAQRMMDSNGGNTQFPYLTTFSKLRSQLDMLNATSGSQQQASQLLNSLINTEDKGSSTSGKKKD